VSVRRTDGALLLSICVAGVLAVALALAVGIDALQRGKSPEGAVMETGLLVAALIFAPLIAYFYRRRSIARPETAGLIFLSTCSIALLGIYFFWVSSYVFFPADMLIWSEGDFVNDILKFTIGYPIYSPQVNNDSLNYVPGAQLLTYFLACLFGKAGSIPAYRVLQLCYAAGAAFLATLCSRRILRLAVPDVERGIGHLWNVLWFSVLLLIATNSLTNGFAHNLHADSLAEMANVAAFYLLLCYIENRATRHLVLMAAMVAGGFFIRQNLVLWGAFYFGFLAVWDRSWKRCLAFAAGAVAALGAAIAGCFAIWGQPFYYWVFYILTKHPKSPLRALLHGLDAWTYFVILFAAAPLLLRGRYRGRLFTAWIITFLLLASETYTSGLGWTLNHLGPGSLLAGVWFLAALASVWKQITDPVSVERSQKWLRAGALTAGIALLFQGLGFVRIPQKQLSADAYRYVDDIQKQFQGVPSDRVLLDLGTWVYWKDKVVMKDRSPSIGARGYAGVGDFSGMLQRIASKRYAKILVHGYNDFDFVYDYFLFPKSTGIRQALKDNYRETGSIRAATGPPEVKNWAQDPYYFGEITILEPRQ
jgi:hypothetical protein